MSYLFTKICFKEKSLYYFHKKIKNKYKNKNKNIFRGFFGVFLGGFFIANPVLRSTTSSTAARCPSPATCVPSGSTAATHSRITWNFTPAIIRTGTILSRWGREVPDGYLHLPPPVKKIKGTSTSISYKFFSCPTSFKLPSTNHIFCTLRENSKLEIYLSASG